jgi:hypothetical protein
MNFSSLRVILLKAILLASIITNLTSSSMAQVSHEILVGRRIGEDFSITASSDYIKFKADAGSCYCCEVLNTEGIANGYFDRFEVRPNISEAPIPLTNRLAGLDNPTIGSGPARACFTVPANIPFPLVELGLDWTGSFPANVRVSCDETTLYSGFNTSVTDFNFLELTNTLDTGTTSNFTPRDLTATVTAINTVPDPDVTVINNRSVVVPAASRVDVDIHSIAGSGAFGPVKICHNGAPGSLKAVVSQYKITSTNPLSFSPVAQDVAKTRGELSGINR